MLIHNLLVLVISVMSVCIATVSKEMKISNMSFMSSVRKSIFEIVTDITCTLSSGYDTIYRCMRDSIR